MGIVACCADHLIISDVGRLAMSGPEVIEASNGVHEFDARDRALVWRTTGGKHRWLSGDCQTIVEDDVAEFRAAATAAIATPLEITLASLECEHDLLARRIEQAPPGADAFEFWVQQGFPDAMHVPDLTVAQLRTLRVEPMSASGIDHHAT
jgi:malonate decarboxylase beta subunit